MGTYEDTTALSSMEGDGVKSSPVRLGSSYKIDF